MITFVVAWFGIGALLSAWYVCAQAPTCCVLGTGSCRTSCEQVSLVAIATNLEEREQQLQSLNILCSKLLVSFWSCMNETLQEIEQGEGWIGRPCCHLPQSRSCRLTCLQTQSRHSLLASCRESDEIAFFTCLDKQHAGDECCNQAQTADCHRMCKEVFLSSLTPSKEIRLAVINSCAHHSPQVLQCMRNVTHVTPAVNPRKNLHCCDKSADGKCRIACRQVLRTKTTGQEIVDTLMQEGCGPPLPHDKLWQCFLKNSNVMKQQPRSVSRLVDLGMDSAKLKCCFRAVTLTCQRLCIKTFTNEWAANWDDFDHMCQYQLAESELLHCLAEVEEPCELGCEGLSYCTNFNHRPTELFRSCNVRAENAAHNDVELWTRGVIRMPLMEIPVLDISQCHPETWKAVACALQIKPCHRQAHVNMICKSDCISLLSKCIDRQRLPEGHTPTTLCEVLSPPGEDPPCISVSSYLYQSPYIGSSPEVTYPCQPNPCNSSQVCTVNRHCLPNQPCLPFTCIPGCKMGEMSHLVFPQGSYIRIPNASRRPHCQKVCRCGNLGQVEGCSNQACLPTDSCWVDGQRFDHNSQFYLDCNKCFCYAGEVTCTQHQCSEGEPSTGLPCNCLADYTAVCGDNGQTYPNACIAKCSGLTDEQIKFRPCAQIDHCSPNPCHHHHRCILRRQVCLSSRNQSCKQYLCVKVQEDCSLERNAPVCDTDNTEHDNLCLLLQHGKTLAYHGKCLVRCNKSEHVCGKNGETFASECAALGNFIPVDYKGRCVAVGPVHSTDGKLGVSAPCQGVVCPPIPSEECTKITLPGSCCAICAGAIQVTYSQKLAHRVVDAVKDTGPTVMQTIARNLHRYVKVAECNLFAYLSIEDNIIIVLVPVPNSPTRLQIETCVREAEKLDSLIQLKSPTLVMDLSLSSFIGATVIHAVQPTLPASASQINPTFLVLLLSLVLLIKTSVIPSLIE